MEHGHILSAGQHRDDSLNAAGIRARFADHQPGIRSFDTERVRGDHILDRNLKLPPGLRAAAVLVGLVERRNELFVLLTSAPRGPLGPRPARSPFPAAASSPRQ